MSTLCVFGVLLTSCSRSSLRPEDPYIPTKDTAMPTQPSPESDANEVGIPAEPTDQGPKTYPAVLVLGPGLARGFLHVGVLKALKKSQIEVGAIIGHEMGSLIGVIYAFSKSENDFEWSILKLKDEVFKDTGLSLGRILKKDNNGLKLKQYLQRLLGSQTLERSKTKLTLLVQEKGKPEPLFIENGPAIEWIWKGFGEEGFFQETLENGKVFKSATEMLPFAVNYAKEMGMGPVIVVDPTTDQLVVSSSDKEKEEKYFNLIKKVMEEKGDQIEQADLVLKPGTMDMGYFDFEKRSTAIYEGEQLVVQKLNDIRKLCGKDPI